MLRKLHRAVVERAGEPTLAQALGGKAQDRYFDPEALARVGLAPLLARLVVEGFLNGLHKSPFHGFSVEFADHREYVAGDDLKYLDWHLYARTDHPVEWSPDDFLRSVFYWSAFIFLDLSAGALGMAL